MRRKQSNKLTLIISLVIIIAVGSLVGFTKQEENRNYQYSNIGTWVVERGDTLWEIALFYSDNRQDTRQVVYDIEQLNGCTANLQIGQVLTVPLYDVIWGKDGKEKN